jgi:hypothetical protein
VLSRIVRATRDAPYRLALRVVQWHSPGAPSPRLTSAHATIRNGAPSARITKLLATNIRS